MNFLFGSLFDNLQYLDKPKYVEATSRGAAIAAGISIGLYNLETLLSQRIDEYETIYKPNIGVEEKIKLEEGWAHAVRLSCLRVEQKS
jgi:glycerol kinase